MRGSCPLSNCVAPALQLRGKLPCLKKAPARQQTRLVAMVLKVSGEATYKLTGIWQWRERVWSEETHALESEWVAYELPQQTQLTKLGCNHFVFTMVHFVFLMFRTWRHAGEREFLYCFFGDKQQAAQLHEDSCMGQHC